jgi:hypothetical protein
MKYNINLIESVWRHWRKPSRTTLDAIASQNPRTMLIDGRRTHRNAQSRQLLRAEGGRMNKFDRRQQQRVDKCGATRKRRFKSMNAAMQFVADLGDECNAPHMRAYHCPPILRRLSPNKSRENLLEGTRCSSLNQSAISKLASRK